MKFSVTDRWGGTDDGPTVERMKEILAQLAEDDLEHPDAWLSMEDGWTLSADQEGLVVWHNVERGVAEPRHMRGVTRERMLELWLLVAQGRTNEIDALPWQPGYGHRPPTEEELEARRRWQLEDARRFFDLLGVERSGTRCAEAGCGRGRVDQSVLCRVHHFEMVRRQPCPFSADGDARRNPNAKMSPVAMSLLRALGHLALAIVTFAMLVWSHGPWFAISFFAIVAAHEAGHIAAARWHSVAVTPPYFLPNPMALLVALLEPLRIMGMLGAFVRIRTDIPSRAAAIDIGAAGPICGFLVVLLLLPLAMLDIEPVPATPGTDSGSLANPLLIAITVPLARGFPDSTPYTAGPFFMAVWGGCWFTTLHLLPLGRADGGRILYGLLGPIFNKVARPTLVLAWVAAVLFHTGRWWLLALVLVTIGGARHPVATDEGTDPGWARRGIALLALVVLVLCVNPHPVRLPSEPSTPRKPAPASDSVARTRAGIRAHDHGATNSTSGPGAGASLPATSTAVDRPAGARLR